MALIINRNPTGIDIYPWRIKRNESFFFFSSKGIINKNRHLNLPG